jgi:hypothetical protein
MRFSTLAITAVLASPLLLSALAQAADAPAPAVSPQAAQAEAVDRAVIAVSRTQINADRQKAVTLSLPLTATEATAFWPLYREYHGKTGELNDRFYNLVIEYAKSYPGVTDEQAQKFIKAYNDIDEDRIDLREKYAKKFLKILPATKVARYLQIEHRLDVLEELDASSQIPLVKPAPEAAPAP